MEEPPNAVDVEGGHPGIALGSGRLAACGPLEIPHPSP